MSVSARMMCCSMLCFCNACEGENEKSRKPQISKFPHDHARCPFFCCGYEGPLRQQIVRFPDVKLARIRNECGSNADTKRINPVSQRISKRSFVRTSLCSLFIKACNSKRHLRTSPGYAQQ